jgi:serine/threonine protein kinase
LEFAEIELGRGAFSVVRRGEHGGAVAIKSLTVSNNVTSVDESANDVSMYDEFCCEATIMSSMHHRNIVRLHGVVLSASTLSLVMELCEGGTLDTFLQKSTVANVSWSLVRIIALDVARALEYMHELQSPVVHRDIRSSNVFLTLPGVDLLKKYTQRQSNNDLIVAKVGDFGLARYLTPNVTESLESWSWMVRQFL